MGRNRIGSSAGKLPIKRIEMKTGIDDHELQVEIRLWKTGCSFRRQWKVVVMHSLGERRLAKRSYEKR